MPALPCLKGRSTMSQVIVLMGVSGTGKTTVGEKLARRIGCDYLEGDDYHPPANKRKMGAGIPLEDEDRWPWFDRLAAAAGKALAQGKSAVLGCSALKRIYRDRLRQSLPTDAEFRLVHLVGKAGLIRDRMDAREHEYMTSTLLDSQLATLEPPASDEQSLEASIARSPEEIVEAIAHWLEEAEPPEPDQPQPGQ